MVAATAHPVQQQKVARVKPEDHLDLVRRVAIRMARRLPKVVDLGDLLGAGALGLLDAVEKYDPARCDNFPAYAEIRIRGAILDALRAMDWVPRSTRHKGHRLDHAMASLQQSLGRAPDDDEMAEQLGVTRKAYDTMRREVHDFSVVSAEDLGPSTSLKAVEAPADSLIEMEEMRDQLAGAIARLPDKERQVLSLYYLEELKLREIGEIFGVTESRICQIHAQAVGRLRKTLAKARA